LRPGIVSAGIVGFLLSFTELPRSIYLRGVTTTMPLFEWAQAASQTSSIPYLFGLSTVILSVSLPLIGVVTWLRSANRKDNFQRTEDPKARRTIMTSVAFDFTGESVLVTGASRGIGFSIAEAFARANAELAILADDDGVHAAAARLTRLLGRPVAALHCDIADRHQVRQALSGIDQIDVLINNAGLERTTPMDEPGDEVEQLFRRIIDVNVIGTYFVTREALPKMQAGGRIIFTASIWSRTAVADFSAYCASKHAVMGFMRSLSKELGPRRINVNAIGPGWVRTEASMLSLRRMSQRTGRSEEELLKEIGTAQAMPGLMDTDDIVELYLFLASPAARNITGQTYGIDRGEVLA